jgi:hypothetical protein
MRQVGWLQAVIYYSIQQLLAAVNPCQVQKLQTQTTMQRWQSKVYTKPHMLFRQNLSAGSSTGWKIGEWH